MRPLRAVLVYVVAVLLGGALLAPWVYQLAQVCSETFPALAQQPFHRFVNRTILVLALIGLAQLLRASGLASAAALGLAGQARQMRRLSIGLLVGFGTVACAAGCVLSVGARKLDPSLAGIGWPGKLLGIAATAAVVGTLEEVLFRGALFGALRRVWNWVFALALSSVLFAGAHFLQSARVEGPVEWYSGFVVLGRMLEGFVRWQHMVPAFLNLTLIGVILGVAYHRTGSLHFPIGLHAGWVFGLKIYGWLTTRAEWANPALWGTHKFVDGWLALAVLIVLCVTALRLFRVGKRESPYARIVF